MPDGRFLQIPSTHLLGQNFSKPFNISYEDKDGEKKYGWQTCFGPAVGRIFAAFLAAHGDNQGMRLTWEVAPLQVVIVPILHGENKELIEKCIKLNEELKEKGVRTYLDDSDKTPGEKFNHWEMMGVPIRVEVGSKELEENNLTIKRRDTGKREKIDSEELSGYLEKAPEEILRNLKKQAEEEFEGKKVNVNTIKDISKALKEKKMARANWCSLELDGEECAEKLSAETKGAKVRGERHGAKETPSGECIVCGKKAKHVIYIAKEY